MPIDKGTPAPQSMTTRKLFASVRHGNRVRCWVHPASPTPTVEGYLAGLDGERMLVLEPGTASGFRQHYVARDCPRFEIETSSRYQDEPAHEDMEAVVGPFRRWIATHHPIRNEKGSPCSTS